MGIPSYFSHIVRKHRNIIKSFKVSDNPKINNLYLDCNSFIYEAFNSINGTLKIKDKHDKNVVLLEDKIITYVCDSLIKYIHLLTGN